MAIKKYSTFEQAEKDLWVLHPDAKYYLRLKRLFEFWNKISKRSIKKGIQKFSSIESVPGMGHGTASEKGKD